LSLSLSLLLLLLLHLRLWLLLLLPALWFVIPQGSAVVLSLLLPLFLLLQLGTAKLQPRV
jgi:hypothetical protein